MDEADISRDLLVMLLLVVILPVGMVNRWLWPSPIRHYHSRWAVGSAHTAAIPHEELIAWIEPPAIGVVAVVARLFVPMTSMVAVWHDTGLLSIFLYVLEQVRAPGVD